MPDPSSLLITPKTLFSVSSQSRNYRAKLLRPLFPVLRSDVALGDVGCREAIHLIGDAEDVSGLECGVEQDSNVQASPTIPMAIGDELCLKISPC